MTCSSPAYMPLKFTKFAAVHTLIRGFVMVCPSCFMCQLHRYHDCRLKVGPTGLTMTEIGTSRRLDSCPAMRCLYQCWTVKLHSHHWSNSFTNSCQAHQHSQEGYLRLPCHVSLLQPEIPLTTLGLAIQTKFKLSHSAAQTELLGFQACLRLRFGPNTAQYLREQRLQQPDAMWQG